jgi:hypothetical protein
MRSRRFAVVVVLPVLLLSVMWPWGLRADPGLTRAHRRCAHHRPTHGVYGYALSA